MFKNILEIFIRWPMSHDEWITFKKDEEVRRITKEKEREEWENRIMMQHLIEEWENEIDKPSIEDLNENIKKCNQLLEDIKKIICE